MVILIVQSEKQLHRICEAYNNKDCKPILDLLMRGPLPIKIFIEGHSHQKKIKKALEKLVKRQLVDDISVNGPRELYVANFSLAPSSETGAHKSLVDKLSNRFSDVLEDFLKRESSKVKDAFETCGEGITLGRFTESIFAEAFEKTFKLLHRETMEEDKRIAQEILKGR